MNLNEELVLLAKKNLRKVDKIKLFDLSSLDKMSSVYNACLGKRDLEKSDYDIFQKYILERSKSNEPCVDCK